MRRLKITFPTDIRKTNIPDIPVLNPGQEIQIPMEIVLTGLSSKLVIAFVTFLCSLIDYLVFFFLDKQLKIDIRNDQGAYAGLFVVNDWDLMIPCSMSCMDFEQSRNRMKGFGEVTKSYPYNALNLSLDGDEDVELQIIKRMNRNLSMFIVQGAGLCELMFAGLIRKGFTEEKVLVTITTSE
jgi:hypothetical protein